VRTLAAATIGQLGEIRLAHQLYEALRDRDEQVRTTAHMGLGSLQAQSGLDLPAPA
jgi:HEAT repeat protein